MSKPAPPRTIRQPTLEQPDPRPLAPVQPGLEDCCRSGCSPCVFDLYEEALERYRARLAAWERRHPTGDRDNGGSPDGGLRRR